MSLRKSLYSVRNRLTGDSLRRRKLGRRHPRTKGKKSQPHLHCLDRDPSRRGIITNWYERKVMERKANTYLLNDNVFQRFKCPNPVTYPNEGARIFRSAVSEKHK